MKQIIKVTLYVPVDLPDDEDYNASYDIEENHCPGTGIVGAAIQKMIDECEEKSTCWACSLNGTNEIIEHEGERNG